MLEDISRNLVNVCDSIIELSEKTQHGPSDFYCRNGKKYRQTSDGSFCRVQSEDKYLIVGRDYTDFGQNCSLCSSYGILKKQGSVLDDYPDLCLAIIFTSREIELNKWYDPSTKIKFVDECNYNFHGLEDEVLDYISGVSKSGRERYVKMGCNLLAATKINFYQSDHHVSWPKLEGEALQSLVKQICRDEEAISVKEVYNSLRAFCHWCSIRGVFFKLGIRGVNIDDGLKFQFRAFPEVDGWIKDTIYDRYPAGTSKFFIVKSALMAISKLTIGKLVAVPSDLQMDNFFACCRQIEADPLRFHVRAATLKLSESSPLSASGMCEELPKLLQFVSILYHSGLPGVRSQFTSSSKLTKYSKLKHAPAFPSVCRTAAKINGLLDLNPNYSDEKILEIVGGEVPSSIAKVVSGCAAKYGLK
ncbi:hypothetical protein HII12_004467 [Brettanomyces bruxellensis]|uniref:Uncharacterized protein n=1 Tax=Dekkera bruxellensis TaxID=5007 RepID=A0A8H6B9N7_DEKBR|nr:hypothetical protein HII12_004467 [Brettanomyces bruxellensis]